MLARGRKPRQTPHDHDSRHSRSCCARYAGERWCGFRRRSDVPLTPRVRQLIDTAEFRRLAQDQPVGPGVAGLSGGDPHAIRALSGRVSAGPAVREATGPRRAIRRGGRCRRGRGLHRRRAAARPGALAVLPPDRRHPAAERAEPRAVRQQFPARRRDRRRAAARLGRQPARRGRAAERETPRRGRQNPRQHALGPDRHRQDGLPVPRQPPRRRSLRAALRPAAAAWAACA